MKILFLTSGSVESNFTYRALSLSRELQKQGHDVALVCPCADKYNGFLPKKVESIDSVRILQPRQFVTKRVEINLLPYIFGALYLTIREKPDLVYIYKPTPASIVGLAAKFLRGTTVVLDMDDLGSEVMKIEGHPKHQQKLIEWCEKIAARYSDRIVVASSYLFNKYEQEFPRKPLHLMPNGIDRSWFAPAVDSQKAKRIVFMGTLGRKNIIEPLFDALPKIIKKHPDTELLLMGDGQYLDYFKEKAIKLGIDENITFTGWLSLEKARENLQSGDLGYGFMPDNITTRAASNMKTPQYLIRGVVPFVSRTGDLPHMVDEGRAGYISPSEKPEDIEAELLRALEDTERKTIKAAAAREFAVQNFGWEKLAKDFERWIFGEKMIRASEDKKIYFVSANVPANVGGGEIRNLYLLRQLLKSGKKVQLFCIKDEKSETALDELQKELPLPITDAKSAKSSILFKLRALLMNRMQPFMDEYRFSGLGKKIRAATENDLPDAIQLEQIGAYYIIRPHLSYLKKRGIKIILDAHNVEAEAFKGAIANFPLPKKLVGKFLLSRLRNLEIEAARNADAVFACSNTDAEYFKKYNSHVYTIANGVDCDAFQPAEDKQGSEIIFIGGTQYSPNADALRFYLKKVHPSVKKKIPDVKLLAVGATKNFLKANGIKDTSIEALGFVPQVKPYLDSASVGICPIRQGSGTRLKVLTFMASGLAIVSTAKGAQGIEYTDGKDILIADDAEKFATSVINLLQKEIERKAMGEEARRSMVRNYDWAVIGEKLNAAYTEILN